MIKGAKAVVMAVIETDNSIFPFESDETKLEIFPPGHEATKIIPNAIIGVMKGFRIRAMRKVTAGRPTHCNNTPKLPIWDL